MPTRADQYADLLEKNHIFLERLRGTLRARQGLASAARGHRAASARSGRAWDLRKAHPYSSYDHFDFKIPVGTVGDNYDRYRVRHAEFYESVKIIEQALDGRPEGPHITTDRKIALPPRHELATSMEALIHHFKLVTEGFRVPPGEAYYPIEGPRGELGCFVRSDGSAKPARVHMRDPSFVNLQALAPMVKDGYIADLIATLAMLDPILGESTDERHITASGPAVRPRVARPWVGRRGRPDQGSGDRPRPGDDADPAGLKETIEAAMAKYPDRRSAAIPALHAAQDVYGWCSPQAIDEVASVMQLTPAYLTSVATFYDMSRPSPSRATTCTCARTSRARCSAPTSSSRRCWRRPRATPTSNVRSFECLGACDIAPMASVNGEYVGPLDLADAERILEDLHAGRTVLEHKQLRYRRSADPGVAEEETDFGPPIARRPTWPILPGSGPRATPRTARARPPRSR